jgi:pimeloyl-ACP methyl ester carboxylesterase
MTTPELPPAASDALAYWTDAWQRSVLFWDVLRERGNLYLDHQRSGKPPVLAFDYEVLLDAREFAQPANYALARIKPPADYPATDPRKRPFVVIDPRAGHGPGIGGFKIDSEIGIALKQSHPCYFVMFYPQPVAGQTIECVARAEAVFLEKVNALHPDTNGKPFVIGNCQGGWALMMLAAAAPQLVGPILLAGSPISYWAGVEGKNPMRYSGGLMGGTWLASFAGDLGHGKFDGSALVTNFEQLDPANTYWSKMYNLYAKIDTEPQRFLEFERWWGGHFLLNKEEMEWISQNLFVGNKLAAGEVVSSSGKALDLRNIRSPIVVFASWGDNITPPQQALNWIPDLYDSVEDIRLNEQTIVYCLHEKVGHLGIFVSAGVAKKEHSELVSALDLIDVLPPGLYEAVITDTQPDMPGLEFTDGRYLIRFEARTIDDILALDDGRQDERAFEVVKRVAEINQNLYNTFVSPWVRALSTEATAEWLRQTSPPRMERWMLSDLNPAMWTIKSLAEMVRAQRQAVSADNAFVKAEKQVSAAIEQGLDRYRDARDAAQEKLFKAIYESPLLAALVGFEPGADSGREAKAQAWVTDEMKRLKRHELEAAFEHGTPLEGVLRVMIYGGIESRIVDERPFNAMRALAREAGLAGTVKLADFKEAVKRQTFVILLDEERALAGLPALLPEHDQRVRALAIARKLAETRGLSATHAARLDRVAQVLGLEATAEARRA